MQIHFAAGRGDHAAIERQLRRGVAVDARDAEGKTPLMYAAAGRRAGPATLRLLLDRGADANAVSTSLQETPLSLAARAGQPSKVRLLLAAGADPRFANRSGYTPITNLPAWRDADHLTVLEILLRAGADPNVASSYGERPLRAALQAGNLPALRLLLKFGTDRSPATMSGLMWAVLLGSREEVAAEAGRGADLQARNCWAMTPWLLSVLIGDVAKAELLLRQGANLGDRGHCGQTPLMYAAQGDHVPMTQWLLDGGADPLETDDFGQTPLRVAAQSGAAACAQLLLEAGAPLMSPDGEPVITDAANEATVRVLLQAGADIDAVGADGYWLLKTAAEWGDELLVRQLLDLGADPNTTSTGETALHTAVTWDHLGIVALLLKHGADPNAADVDGWTPLMAARSLEGVELLLAAGADIAPRDLVGADVIQHHRDPEILDRLKAAGATVRPTPGAMGSLLHTAAQDGDLELLDYLLGHQLDVNTATGWGLTPLMSAAERGHAAAIRRLLGAGAKVHARDEQGRTALFYAAAPEAFTAFQLLQEFSRDELAGAGSLDFGYRPSDDVAALDLLIAAGAKLEQRDADGCTPLLVACRCGRPARVARLIARGAATTARNAAGQGARELAAQHHDLQQSRAILALLAAAG